MNEYARRLLAILSMNYKQQSISTIQYPCTIELSSVSGPYIVQHPRSILLLGICNLFYDDYEGIYGSEVQELLLELSDIGCVLWINNIDIACDYIDRGDANQPYEYALWAVFRRYAKIIIDKCNIRLDAINYSVDDLVTVVAS